MTTKDLNKIGVKIIGCIPPDEFKRRVKGAISLKDVQFHFPCRKNGIYYTKSKWRKVWEKTGGNCAYCGRELTLGTWSTDHIIPRSKGGTGRIENLVLSCRNCNSKKSSELIQPKFIIK